MLNMSNNSISTIYIYISEEMPCEFRVFLFLGIIHELFIFSGVHEVAALSFTDFSVISPIFLGGLKKAIGR